MEEGMATHSPILARKSPWTEEPGKESDRTEVTEHAPISNFKKTVGSYRSQMSKACLFQNISLKDLGITNRHMTFQGSGVSIDERVVVSYK